MNSKREINHSKNTADKHSELYDLERDITQRKQAEDALRKNEELLNAIVESAKDSIFIKNTSRQYIKVNKAMEALFGMTKEDMLGKTDTDLFGPENAGHIEEIDSHVLEGKTVEEFPSKPVNGELKHFHTIKVPLRDSDGLVTGLCGIARDITDSKLAEANLRISEEKYRNIFESMQDVYYEASLEGTILEISPSIEYFSKGQLTREELLGKSLIDFYTDPDDRNTFFIELNKKGIARDYELSMRNKDGSIVPISISSIVLPGPDGKPGRISGIMRDITERKLAEDALKQSENDLNNAQEIARMGSWEYNLVTNKYSWSKNNYNLVGLKPFETVVKPEFLLKMVHPDDRFVLDESFRKITSNKTAVSMDLRIVMPDNRIVWLQNSIVPVFDGDILIAYKGVNIDITEKKYAEQEIRDLNKALALTIDERNAQLSVANGNLQKEIEERKKATAALKEALERLHKVTDLVPGVVYQFRMRPDGSSCFPYASKGISDIYKVSPEEVAEDASAVFKNLHPDDFDAVVASIQSSAANMKLWHHEYRVRFADGTVRWLLGNAMPQPEQDGSVLWHGFITDITERRQAEKELQQVSTRLKLAASAGGVGVWDYDITNNLLVWDHQMYSLYGIHEEDFSGAYDAWQTGLHPDDAARGDEEIQMAIRGEKEFDTEFRVVWPDETIHYIRAYAIVYRDKDGKASHMIGTNWDITSQKQLETLLNQTRENYEMFFNTIDDFLFVLDEQGNMIHTNSTVTKRLEYTTQELFEKSVLMVHPSERREEAGRIVGEMLAGTADYCPVPLITKSGNYIPVETRVKIGFWNGKPAIFGVSKDISKIKLSEEKFSKAFQSNSALMAISHGDGRLLDVNETFLNTLGYSREEVINKTSLELNLFRDTSLRERITEQLKQNIPVREFELAAVKKDGSEIMGLFSADTIYIGKDLCLLTMMVDITARKQAEEEIRKARNEAEKANLAKSEFLSRMSHELRTPMNSILGFAQLMIMGELNPAHKKGVNHIIKSGTHLLPLINEILDISRIEAGRITLSLEPVQLSSIILEMIDIIQPNASKRKLRVEFEQSLSNLLYVKADRQRLKQVLLNLINNAVKYNREEGSVTIKTELHQLSAPDVSSVRISVIDSGVGISQEEFSKLFLPFERIGAERSDTEGTGLGLAVVKKLMDVMGGTVGVESIVGQGSTFWIELPQAESMEKQIVRASEALEQDMITRERKGTILYIEDNISNADLVHDILENHRPAVQLMTSMYGAQAVKLATEIHPDLILLDLDLPDMHGSQVLAKLKEDNVTCQIPVVIISADAMPKMVELLMLAGAEDYLTKPLDIIGFLLMIDEWIENRQS